MPESVPQKNDANYRPEIDGLRALAVVAVVLFHAGFGCSGGYVGVDVFFVISGFLITGIIQRALDRGQFSLVEFWERRVRRIFPPLIAMIAVVLIAGCWVLLPSELEELGKSAIAQSLLIANIFFWRSTGYFAGAAELKPLLHTWSLAVEEQFYLFFPFLLIAFRRQSRQRLVGVVLLLTMASFFASVYGARFYPASTFFLLPTRSWELLVGCLLAISPSRCLSRPRLDTAISWAGLACILLPVFLYNAQTAFPGLAALPPVAGTAAIIYATAATPHTIIRRLLAARPLVFVGMISYSLYLWHWPVLAYCRITEQTSRSELVTASIVFVILSILSWKLIETPFRNRTFASPRWQVFSSAVLCSFLVICTGAFLLSTHGLSSRLPGSVAILVEDVTYTGKEFERRGNGVFEPAQMRQLGEFVDSNQKLDFLLWGDSHGLAIASLFDDVAKVNHLTGVARLEYGVCPVPGAWQPKSKSDVGGRKQRADHAAFVEYLNSHPPRNLVLVARWSLYCAGYTKMELDESPTMDPNTFFLSDSDAVPASMNNSQQILGRQLRDLNAICEELNIKLWIVKQIPETGENSAARDYLKWTLGRRREPPGRTLSFADHNERQRAANLVLDRLDSNVINVVDPAPLFFDESGNTVNFKDGRACYKDNDHVTRWGAEALRNSIEQMFSEMKEEKRSKLASTTRSSGSR